MAFAICIIDFGMDAPTLYLRTCCTVGLSEKT